MRHETDDLVDVDPSEDVEENGPIIPQECLSRCCRNPECPGDVRQFKGMAELRVGSMVAGRRSRFSTGERSRYKDTCQHTCNMDICGWRYLVRQVSQSLWSVVQLVLLLLWALCGVTIAHGLEIDVDIQLNLPAAPRAGQYREDRLPTVIYACEVLDEGMLQGVQHVIVFFCIFWQTFLVVIINFGRRRYTAVDRGAHQVTSTWPSRTGRTSICGRGELQRLLWPAGTDQDLKLWFRCLKSRDGGEEEEGCCDGPGVVLVQVN